MSQRKKAFSRTWWNDFKGQYLAHAFGFLPKKKNNLSLVISLWPQQTYKIINLTVCHLNGGKKREFSKSFKRELIIFLFHRAWILIKRKFCWNSLNFLIYFLLFFFIGLLLIELYYSLEEVKRRHGDDLNIIQTEIRNLYQVGRIFMASKMGSFFSHLNLIIFFYLLVFSGNSRFRNP